MNLLIVFRISLRALLRNKVRSLLTTLGIIVGIAAVIAVIAVGQGATVMIRAQMNSLGNNLVTIFPGSQQTGGFHGGAGTQQTLAVEDADAIGRECSYIKAVTPLVRSGGQVVYQEKNWGTQMQGVSTSYVSVRNWQVEDGDFFTDGDVRSASRVCVMGRTAVKQLFGDEDPLGKTIRIRNIPFRVVGVMSRKGTAAWGQDQDDTIIVPWTTVRRVLQKSPFNNVNQILISLTTLEVLEPARKEIGAILRERHHLQAGADDDFTVMDMTEITDAITKVSRMMTVLLTVIASISLVVGGIGIMNIMLVSVTERTREIGLRLAVGARRKDILRQFLVEAVVLSGLGGVLGILLGTAAAQAVSKSQGWPVLISAGSVILAMAFAGAVGVFFGFYPAWRAARLNPIEALRYE